MDKFTTILEYNYYINNEKNVIDEDEDEFEEEGLEGEDEIEDAEDGEEEEDDEDEFEEEGEFEDVGNEDEFEEEDFEEGEDEVEIDVSELVEKQNEIESTVGDINNKMESLTVNVDKSLQGFKKIEAVLASLNQLKQTTANLDKEIQKRNPTPWEKMEMRSADTFPYNTKISDYFKAADSMGTEYQIMNGGDPNANTINTFQKDKEKDKKRKEDYILTTDDIEDDFSEWDIKNSF